METSKYRAKTISVPTETMKILDEYKQEIEKKLGVPLSYPQVITYLIKNRSK